MKYVIDPPVHSDSSIHLRLTDRTDPGRVMLVGRERLPWNLFSFTDKGMRIVGSVYVEDWPLSDHKFIVTKDA